jgi:GNAT superfamily N-acetyltransferase
MEILPASEKHLLGIMYLVKEVTTSMNKKGIYHWNTTYPDHETLMLDISQKSLFIAIDTGVVVGMMALKDEAPNEYEQISWNIHGDKVLFVHRMAVYPGWENKGVAEKLISFATDHGKNMNYSSIRLDISGLQNDLGLIYEKQGFKNTGKFLFPFQKKEFVCFEKEI